MWRARHTTRSPHNKIPRRRADVLVDQVLEVGGIEHGQVASPALAHRLRIIPCPRRREFLEADALANAGAQGRNLWGLLGGGYGLGGHQDAIAH